MSKLLIIVSAALFLIMGMDYFGNEFVALSYDQSQPFDKETCERNCRRRFGGEMLGVMDSCMQECDNVYWKDFDRRIRELEKSLK